MQGRCMELPDSSIKSYANLHGIMGRQTDYFAFNHSVQIWYEQIFSSGICSQIFEISY